MRITVGAVVAGTLAFVALVAGVMSATSGASAGWFGDPGPIGLDASASAEVLDVDDYWDWPTVDVRWTTADGEVVVTYVDWDFTDDLPDVGDQVGVIYDSADPEFAFAAEDPYASGALDVDEDASGEETVAGEGGSEAGALDESSGRVREVSGWVALAALLGLALTVVLTVVAAVRAPGASSTPAVPGGAGGWYDIGQPYPAGPYPGQPYAGQQQGGRPDPRRRVDGPVAGAAAPGPSAADERWTTP